MRRYIGKRVFDGVVIGNIILYEENIQIEDNISEGIEIEIVKFNSARKSVIQDYNKLIHESNRLKDNKNILLSYISILEDLDLIETTEDLIKKENLSAEVAVSKSCHILKQILLNLENEYLRERANDIEEVCNKIIKKLQNKHEINLMLPSIILARNMTVSSLLQIDLKNVLGLVLEDASPNSHIAILARSLSIPCIASLSERIKIKNNQVVILDSSNNCIIVDPTKKELSHYQKIIEKSNFDKQMLDEYKYKDIKTIDNKKIKVYANISSALEVDNVLENNADGIGLFRSEYLYLNSDTFPTEDEQFIQYKKCISSLKNKPTIIRTMDIGADKQVIYFNLPKESNPALGYRGVRLYKEYKDVFMTQLKALLRASIYGDLRIMIPMITNVDQMLYVLSCIKEAKVQLKLKNIEFNENVKIGAMIETPAAALICDEIAKVVDFFSIGTNDLTQYLLAIDRENPKVLDIYDPKHKSILKLIYYVSSIAKQNNIEVGICGELARNKDLLSFYIKCGIDEISVSTSYILECKKNITKINTNDVNIDEYIK